MAGYIGSKASVTQVDGYNTTEADAEFLNQTEGDARYVELAGDTLTGALTGTDLTLSGGVYLGGTGSANKLDDYEEGTWTPVITGGVSGSSSGWYRKVGSIVYIAANIYRPTDISSSTDVSISGLPFAGDTTVGFTQNVGIALRYANVSGKQLAGFGIGSGATSGAIRIFSEASGDYDGLQHTSFTSSYSAIQINGTYITNS